MNKLKWADMAAAIGLCGAAFIIIFIGFGPERFAAVVDAPSVVLTAGLSAFCVIAAFGLEGVWTFLRTVWRFCLFNTSHREFKKSDLELTAKIAGAWVWLVLLAGLIGDYIGVINVFGFSWLFDEYYNGMVVSRIVQTSFYGLLCVLLMLTIKLRSQALLRYIDLPPSEKYGSPKPSVFVAMATPVLVVLLAAIIALPFFLDKGCVDSGYLKTTDYSRSGDMATRYKYDSKSFVYQEEVPGTWYVIGEVDQPEDFKNGATLSTTSNWHTKYVFHRNGRTDSYDVYWSGYWLLYPRNGIAEKFVIKTIDKQEYMFIENYFSETQITSESITSHRKKWLVLLRSDIQQFLKQ